MAEAIGNDEIRAMIMAAVETIRENHTLLSKLDSVIGDGDHGSAMLRSMEEVAKGLDSDPNSDLKDVLFNIGWAVMGAAGGSTGPLLGSFFTGMSGGVADLPLDCAGTLAMIEAGIAGIQQQSKAKVGDKTMMDALLPALDAMKAADPGTGLKACLQQAADAAAAGAEATKGFRAKFGRARNLGDRVLGHMDPGSKSMALIFQAFADAVN